MYIKKGLNTSFNALKALSKLGLHATQLYPRSDILSYFVCITGTPLQKTDA